MSKCAIMKRKHSKKIEFCFVCFSVYLEFLWMFKLNLSVNLLTFNSCTRPSGVSGEQVDIEKEIKTVVKRRILDDDHMEEAIHVKISTNGKSNLAILLTLST